MMALAIGLAVGAAVSLFGRLARIDHERGFYPTVLIVVGHYYVLFAALQSPEAIGPELVGMAGFVALAIVGLRTTPWLVAAGLAAHGGFDVIHALVVANAGVPDWWPAFCGGADVTLAGGLALRLRTPQSWPSPRPSALQNRRDTPM